ncbi:MAG: 3-dehydroquinate synthase [Aggregatilineales bacterium]
MAHIINVDASNGRYGIVIDSGLVENIAQHAQKYALTERVGVVTNDTLAPIYGEKLVANLPNAVLVTMSDGEQYKTMESVTELCREFARKGLDRHSLVLALGGGVVGDTAGFAAATYMRGVTLVQMPTTLLSMVDSSVGGKVGVDLPEGKNLAGAFKQPDLVLIDPDVLKTLPEGEWRNGMAEVIKHGLLADSSLLDPSLHTLSRAYELITRAVQVKVDVIVQDPFEKGIRAFLNLGHTFGHAVELVTNFAVPHGEGVAIGLMAAAKLSHRLSLCGQDIVTLTEETLERVGLPTTTNGLDPEAFYAAMSTDKKWRDGRSRFVLLRAVGQPLIMEDVPKADVIAVLEELK